MSDDAITFEATIYSQRTDADGETKLTLCIPNSELDAVVKLLRMGSLVLGVAVSALRSSED